MVGGRDLVGVCQVELESILGKHEIRPAVWQVRLLVMGQSDKQLCTIPLYIHPRHCFAQQLLRQLSYDGPLTKLGKADSLFLLDLVCAGGKHAGSSGSAGAVCFDSETFCRNRLRFTAALFTKTRVVKLRLRSPLSGTANSFTRMFKLTTWCLLTPSLCVTCHHFGQILDYAPW